MRIFLPDDIVDYARVIKRKKKIPKYKTVEKLLDLGIQHEYLHLEVGN